MKIVDESILFFSLKILSRSSLHFVGIKIFIVGCVWNAKSQVYKQTRCSDDLALRLE